MSDEFSNKLPDIKNGYVVFKKKNFLNDNYRQTSINSALIEPISSIKFSRLTSDSTFKSSKLSTILLVLNSSSIILITIKLKVG